MLGYNYNTCNFRSRTEARWAAFFDIIGVRWRYEDEGYRLNDNTNYLPDFYLPEYRLWLEIKGQPPTAEEMNKVYNLFHDDAENAVMIIHGPPFENTGILCFRAPYNITLNDYTMPVQVGVNPDTGRLSLDILRYDLRCYSDRAGHFPLPINARSEEVAAHVKAALNGTDFSKPADAAQKIACATREYEKERLRITAEAYQRARERAQSQARAQAEALEVIKRSVQRAAEENAQRATEAALLAATQPAATQPAPEARRAVGVARLCAAWKHFFSAAGESLEEYEPGSEPLVFRLTDMDIAVLAYDFSTGEFGSSHDSTTLTDLSVDNNRPVLAVGEMNGAAHLSLPEGVDDYVEIGITGDAKLTLESFGDWEQTEGDWYAPELLNDGYTGYTSLDSLGDLKAINAAPADEQLTSAVFAAAQKDGLTYLRNAERITDERRRSNNLARAQALLTELDQRDKHAGHYSIECRVKRASNHLCFGWAFVVRQHGGIVHHEHGFAERPVVKGLPQAGYIPIYQALKYLAELDLPETANVQIKSESHDAINQIIGIRSPREQQMRQAYTACLTERQKCPAQIAFELDKSTEHTKNFEQFFTNYLAMLGLAEHLPVDQRVRQIAKAEQRYLQFGYLGLPDSPGAHRGHDFNALAIA